MNSTVLLRSTDFCARNSRLRISSRPLLERWGPQDSSNVRYACGIAHSASQFGSSRRHALGPNWIPCPDSLVLYTMYSSTKEGFHERTGQCSWYFRKSDLSKTEYRKNIFGGNSYQDSWISLYASDESSIKHRGKKKSGPCNLGDSSFSGSRRV